MKNTLLALLGFILLSTPLAATAQQSGDFTYSSDGSAITITGYTGPGGAVTIPTYINGLPVTTIGNDAFQNTALTGVTIPGNVTSIGPAAFSVCTSLIAITVDAANAFYSSSEGVLFNKTLTTLIQCPGGKAGSYLIPSSITNISDYAFWSCTSLTSVSIPGSVTSIGNLAFTECASLGNVTIPESVTIIGDYMFYNCTSLASVTIPGKITRIGTGMFCFCGNLTSITIPGSVTNIGSDAFDYCTSLQGVFFKGNLPSSGSVEFYSDNSATVYYLPGTTGWGATFAGRPAVLWNPLMQSSGPSFGVGPAGFGFNITGTADIPIVVEACRNLANASWVPLQSLNLTNGAFYFSDPYWTNYPARNYRIRSP